MAAVAHPRLAPAEFLALQTDAGWRLAVELIDGEAVVIRPAGGRAASVQGEFNLALCSWQETAGDGELLLQDVFVRLPDDQYVAPGIAWWSQTRRPLRRDGALDTVGDLVIEVLSPATRSNDLGAKRRLYPEACVREPWLVDLDAAVATCVDGDGTETRFESGESLGSALVPGFSADLARALRA